MILSGAGMRRLAVLGALVLVTGCDKVQEAFSTAPPAAAEVQGVPLKIDRLATAMNGLKGLPLNAEAARGIAGLWVDHMLFAQALARRNDLADSAFAADALWADIMELQAARWHDTLMAGRAAVAGPIADSIYRTDDERIFQHFLVKSTPQQPQHLRLRHAGLDEPEELLVEHADDALELAVGGDEHHEGLRTLGPGRKRELLAAVGVFPGLGGPAEPCFHVSQGGRPRRQAARAWRGAARQTQKRHGQHRCHCFHVVSWPRPVRGLG